MKGQASGTDGLLVVLALLVGIALYGPLLAQQLSLSVQQMFISLAPIAAPVLLGVLIVMLVRMYWSRW